MTEDFTIKKASENDIETILRLEMLAFLSPETEILDPVETEEGIKTFFRYGGEIYFIGGNRGFIERIPLHMLTLMDDSNLEKESPLKQIISKKRVLEKAFMQYFGKAEKMWYMHGVGVDRQFRNRGYASKMQEFLLNLSPRDIHLTFIDAGPETKNINTASFCLAFSHNFVIDGYEKEVYLKNTPYLRLSNGVNYELGKKKIEVDLTKRYYTDDLISVIADGCIGTKITLKNDKKPDRFIFYERK